MERNYVEKHKLRLYYINYGITNMTLLLTTYTFGCFFMVIIRIVCPLQEENYKKIHRSEFKKSQTMTKTM